MFRLARHQQCVGKNRIEEFLPHLAVLKATLNDLDLDTSRKVPAKYRDLMKARN